MKLSGNVTHQPYQPVIIGHRGGDPAACALCRREVKGLGFGEPRRPIMWICTDCVPHAEGFYRMTSRELSFIENRACLEAAQSVAGDQVETILIAMFNAGVTDLAAMSREQLDAIIDTMKQDGSLSSIARATVLAFGESIRRNANEAPF